MTQRSAYLVFKPPLLLILLLTQGLFSSTGHAEGLHPLNDNAISSIRRVLGLKHPYRIERTWLFRDGGSMGAALEDTEGNEVMFCADLRARMFLEGCSSDSTYGHISIGALHFDDPGAQRLPVGGEVETILLDALRVYAFDHFTEAEVETHC